MGFLRLALGVTEATASVLRRAVRDQAKGSATPGASERRGPSDKAEAKAIAAIGAAVAAQGDAVEDVVWPAFLATRRRLSEARSRAQDTVLGGYLVMAGTPLCLLVALAVVRGLDLHGPGWDTGLKVAAVLYGLGLLATLYAWAAARKQLRLGADDASGKVVVALSGRRLYKAWFEDGTRLRVASLPRERARVSGDGRPFRVMDGTVPFVDLDWTRQASRMRIVAALGGVG